MSSPSKEELKEQLDSALADFRAKYEYYQYKITEGRKWLGDLDVDQINGSYSRFLKIRKQYEYACRSSDSNSDSI